MKIYFIILTTILSYTNTFSQKVLTSFTFGTTKYEEYSGKTEASLKEKNSSYVSTKSNPQYFYITCLNMKILKIENKRQNDLGFTYFSYYLIGEKLESSKRNNLLLETYSLAYIGSNFSFSDERMYKTVEAKYDNKLRVKYIKNSFEESYGVVYLDVISNFEGLIMSRYIETFNETRMKNSNQ